MEFPWRLSSCVPIHPSIWQCQTYPRSAGMSISPFPGSQSCIGLKPPHCCLTPFPVSAVLPRPPPMLTSDLLSFNQLDEFSLKHTVERPVHKTVLDRLYHKVKSEGSTPPWSPRVEFFFFFDNTTVVVRFIYKFF